MNIDRLIEQAKNLLLKQGEIPSCLFVEFDGTNMVILAQTEHPDNAADRAWMDFLTGRFFALKSPKQYKKCKITGVHRIAEVWYNSSPVDEKTGGPRVRPSVDPSRKEGLQITSIDPVTMKQSGQLYEILRDGSGSLVDLLKDSFMDEESELRGAALPAFLAGYRSAKQHQSQAIHVFRQTYEKHAARVPQ